MTMLPPVLDFIGIGFVVLLIFGTILASLYAALFAGPPRPPNTPAVQGGPSPPHYVGLYWVGVGLVWLGIVSAGGIGVAFGLLILRRVLWAGG